MNLVYMKTKIYLGILSLVLGLSLASCSEDDDYTIHTTPILNESSVVTGSSDVTATTATLHATPPGWMAWMPEAIRPASSMVLARQPARGRRLLMTVAPSVLS